MFQIKKISYEDVELDRADLVTLAEAGRMTGLTMPGIASAISRGQLTEIIDPDAGYHGRRLLLRSEVVNFKHGRVVA